MKEVLGMNNIKNANMSTIDWAVKGYKKDGSTYPLKTWKNVECVLDKYNQKLKYNLVTKQMIGEPAFKDLDNLVTEIHGWNVEEFLNMSRDQIYNAIYKIADEHSFNPFVDMIKKNENTNYALINELFKCIKINDANKKNYDYYFTIFTKWCLNVVKMAQNTIDKEYRSEGILVLQGKQGCRKTTFVQSLMPIRELYKGDKSLNPENIDSVVENTKYILVEWGELEHTMKAEQSKLKQYITCSIDEYRSPYARTPKKHPRLTSYVGTVNRKDFLKDETGSRRFWIIPVEGFDFEKLEAINKEELWGAVYSLWKSGNIKEYLEEDEMEKLNKINAEYNYKNDISYIIDEKINWNKPEYEWCVYKLTEIAEHLMIKEKKQLKIELEKKGIEYKVHRINSSKVQKGFCIPKLDKYYS